jgi:hypothetical protein
VWYVGGASADVFELDADLPLGIRDRMLIPGVSANQVF